ncbi:MAG: DUF4139 domain-containing protein [Myxococcota bacterium]|nr:DUF4139 domain-containing protein [Myxococcota bacterium]
MHPWVGVLLGALAAVEAPVTEATVYGDRARVVRTATVEVSGTTAVELPLLEESVDPASLRVEADGATVDRVELQRAAPEEFPETAARRLLGELEALDDQLQRVQGEREAVSSQLERIKGLSPQRAPAENGVARPDLDPSGWTASLQFMADRAAGLEQQVRDHDQQLQTLGEQRARKVQEAQLLGEARMVSGWRVTAHLSGKGRAKLRLIYQVPRARWAPLYELQLVPEANEVQLNFYGLVSQETGDDWKDTALILSTAVPSTAMSYPKLLTWKIGVQDRFIPTPAPMMEQVRPPPPAPPLPVARTDAAQSYQEVLAQLNQRVGGGLGGPEQAMAMAQAREQQHRQTAARAERERRQRSRAVPRPQAPPMTDVGSSSSQPSQAAAPSAMPAPSAASDSYGVSEEENGYLVGGVSVNDPGFGINGTPSAESFLVAGGQGAPRAPQPTQGVGLMPPPSYRAPPLDPNSPAGRAGGHDLAFASARREEVLSGKGGRKVALFSERWPVKLERKLFPAIAPYAFLVGELTSPSKQVMPAAPAQLFVGQDPAGTADLKLISPGEKVTLPLGVDRAIKPVRNVELVQSEKGFIGKDDVGEYRVTIEVANPYGFPLPVRIHDQWPLQGNDKAEVKLGKVEPAAASKDDQKGMLEWALTLPPGGKTKVSFRYTLKRPKDWRMEQRQEVVR